MQAECAWIVGCRTLTRMVNVTRRCLLTLSFALFLPMMSPAARAQDWARAALDKSPRHREYVPIKTAAGRTVNTYVVYPEVSGKAPVVLLIHEIFGLTDWAKLMADELAAKGYIVVAPDLLSGTSPSTPPAPGGAGAMHGPMHVDANTATAHAPTAATGTDSYGSVDAIVQAVSSLPAAQVMGDLDAVADYAQHGIPSANGRLAVSGFCWGGGQTFAFATHRQGLAASFVFYGPAPDSGMKEISAPVYGFYAGNDARISANLPMVMAAMTSAGKKFDPVTYDGAGHGFMRAGQAPDATPANKTAWNEGFARFTKLLTSMQ